MNNLFWFAGPLLLVGIAALITRRVQCRARRERQQAGLRRLDALRQLLDLLQQHRGLSTGLLNGSDRLLGQVQALQRRIGDRQHQLEQAPNLQQDERWQALVEHWTRLAERFHQLSPADNLRQHNQLTQALLYLIDDQAQQSDLMLLRTDEQQPLRLAWRELLTAVECIGQARAVGTGAVAAGGCDTVTRIRLTYLCQKIERTSALAWQALPPSPQEREQLNQLMACIRSELIERREPTLDVDTYFGVATRAIEGLYAQYDASMLPLSKPRDAA